MTFTLIFQVCLICVCSLCLCAQGGMIKAQPGQNVSIHCELNNSETYWFVEHAGHPLLAVMRTVDSMPVYSNGFEERHVIRENNSLWILNVTSADSAHYHCAGRQEGTFVFSNAIQLAIQDSTDTTTDSPGINTTSLSKAKEYDWTTVAYISALAISLLINAVLAVCTVLACKRRRSPCITRPQAEDQEDDHTYAAVKTDNNELEMNNGPISSTYAMISMIN
ncbi:uncharacterized protein LOC120514906 [Polypterus senegalus]|uniref:uncharacterized protein LOC120514906 n=1 Tax=Polypterus senegalus TaxID=55291 RepID=UPI001964DFE3|nr:uncharacterized protein LOC120514906 [Polypterus senegalus]